MYWSSSDNTAAKLCNETSHLKNRLYNNRDTIKEMLILPMKTISKP